MPAAPADSALYRDLFGDAETAALFTDSAEVRAMLIVEGALARVQGDLGIIPAEAAAFLHRASLEVQIDPAALAAETARNGVPVPALVAAFRKGAEAPEMTRWLHWGATSQDIMDTALALRLKRLVALWDVRLGALAAALGQMAADHAETPMAARTYGQAAVPTSFGALVAGWGRPVMRHRARLAALAPDLLRVSLSGAAGTSAALGPQAAAVRAGLAQALGLADPGASWHAERDGIGAFAAWMAGLTATLGKMGQDLILLSQTGIAEVAMAGAGGSSTMPQKQNPVGPSVLVALARQSAALAEVVQGAGVHGLQRDGAAWFAEWLTLPQLVHSTGRALVLAADLAARVRPDPAAMARGLAEGQGTLMAEALTFALAGQLPRPEAAARVAALCREALASATPLADLAARDFPGTDWAARLAGPGALGDAPAEARAFAAAALSSAAGG
ncbi:MAG: lyase family protein [Gemmobacter sp.]|uniref:lyase family protein n=1 Tax=Gemmobacter sp. TaxID=1898957 RepID=UPI003919EF33